MIQKHGWKHLLFLQMEMFPEFLNEHQVLRLSDLLESQLHKISAAVSRFDGVNLELFRINDNEWIPWT